MVDLFSSLIAFIVVTLGSTYLVALAYKNTKFLLKHKVSEAITFVNVSSSISSR